MSTAYWCVLAAALLPYLTVGLAKYLGAYDNAKPRSPDTYAGLSARANNAHLNGLEVFPFFAAAVIVATKGSPQHSSSLADSMALGWIVVRLGYTAAYLADRAMVRSLVWLTGWGLTIAMFTMPVWQR